MGGDTNTMTSGLAVEKPAKTSRISVKMGSTRVDALALPREDRSVRKLVRQATMQEFEAVRTERSVSAKTENLLQLSTWHSSIRGLARRLREVMLRPTLESPTMEKHRCWDMMAELNTEDFSGRLRTSRRCKSFQF